MTREEAKERFWYDSKYDDNHNEIIDYVFDDFESRNCTNCKWYQNEVCVNDESRLCADFVSDSDICKLWKDKQ